MKNLMCMGLLMAMSIVSMANAATTPIVDWDYQYNADLLPGVDGAIDDGGAGTMFTGSAAVTVPTSNVYLGSGADAGTLFIDDLNGTGGNNYVFLNGYNGFDSLTIHCRMAVLEDNPATNTVAFSLDDGFLNSRFWIRTDSVYGSETIFLDMTQMRDFWITLAGDGSPGHVWIEDAATPGGWIETDMHAMSASYSTVCRVGDVYSSDDFKQQWDFINWTVGEAIAVPEPLTVTFLSLGGCLLIGRRKK